MAAASLVASTAGQKCQSYASYSQSRHQPFSTGAYELAYQRPEPACRTFNSSLVEDAIDRIRDQTTDPDLFRLFDVVWALTRGGPGTMTETVSIYAYAQGFQQFETSYTAAMTFVIIVILNVLVILALRRVEIAR